MAWFMFGYQILHLVGTTTVSYVMLHVLSPEISHKAVFVFMMGYLFARSATICVYLCHR